MTDIASRIDGLLPEKRALPARIVRRGGSPALRASGRLADAPGRPRRAESTRGIDVFPAFPRPAALPDEVGSVRVPHTRFTVVPWS